jgi:hypothetical protein
LSSPRQNFSAQQYRSAECRKHQSCFANVREESYQQSACLSANRHKFAVFCKLKPAAMSVITRVRKSIE